MWNLFNSQARLPKGLYVFDCSALFIGMLECSCIDCLWLSPIYTFAERSRRHIQLSNYSLYALNIRSTLGVATTNNSEDETESNISTNKQYSLESKLHSKRKGNIRDIKIRNFDRVGRFDPYKKLEMRDSFISSTVNFSDRFEPAVSLESHWKFFFCKLLWYFYILKKKNIFSILEVYKLLSSN